MSKHPVIRLGPISTIHSFYELSAPLLDGSVEQFKSYEGKTTVVVNIATGDFNARLELRQLNELVRAYETKGLRVLAFPCNQFENGETFENDEILSIMYNIRPGGKFEPKFKVFAKCDVNGMKASPVFEYLKLKLPRPDNDDDVIIAHDKQLPWTPVKRQDIGWNYEKFLIAPDGHPVKRYTSKANIDLLRRDIEHYSKKTPRHARVQHGFP